MDKHDFQWIVIMVLVCVGVLFACWGNYEAYKSECLAYGELTGYEVRLLESNRCMVNHPDEGWTTAWGR